LKINEIIEKFIVYFIAIINGRVVINLHFVKIGIIPVRLQNPNVPFCNPNPVSAFQIGLRVIALRSCHGC